MKLSLKLTTLLAPVFAIIVAFGLSTIMLYLIGEDPIETFKIMYDYGKTGKSIVSILPFHKYGLIGMPIEAVATSLESSSATTQEPLTQVADESEDQNRPN